MYSGISGLKNFQTKLDVIGNNISNVNTYGFKKGRTIFKDLISQTTAGASAATATRGGVNAKQVGLGSQLAAIDTIHTGGALQSTGNTLDLAISGDGFFQVADSTAGQGGFTNIQYTRAGNFYMDQDGYFVDSAGKYLVGTSANVTLGFGRLKAEDGTEIDYNIDSSGFIYDNADPKVKITTTDIDGMEYELKMDSSTGKLYAVNDSEKYLIDNTNFTFTKGTDEIDFDDAQDIYSAIVPTGISDTYTAGSDLKPIKVPTDAQSMSIGQDGTISFVDKNGDLQLAGMIQMAKFPNAGGLQKVGGNYFQQTANSGNPLLAAATTSGMGSINSGFLEMSNVDLSEEFTDMIVAQRGFQANTRIITTSDSILEELINLKR